MTVVLIGLFAAERSRLSSAHDATPAAGGQGFAGSWRATISPAGGPTFVALFTLGAEGTANNSGAPAQPPPPGVPARVVFSSTGHGAWEATGPDSAIVTVVELRADEQGRPLGTLTVRASFTLAADGQTLDGTAVTTIADPAGAEVVSFPSTFRAERLVAEAPGTPMAATHEAGTPAP